MARFCTSCGGELPEGAAACPKCGAGTVPTVIPPASAQGGLADNIAGLLCYFPPTAIIADIVFLLVEPYNKNKFIRFHAFQSLFTAAAIICLSIVMWIAVVILAMIPVLGWILAGLLWFVLFVGSLLLWIVMMIKAYQGQMYKLPYIGDLAEKQANA